MQQLLTDIKTRLIAEVPALKYVDEDWGQLDFYSQYPPVQWPCALVDVGGVTWTNQGKLGQLGLAQVKIRVADLRLSNSSGLAPVGQQQANMAIFTLLANVYKALHGWAGSNHYSRLIRTANSRIRREDGVRIYELSFTTELYDGSARPAPATAPAQALVVAGPTL